MGGLTEKGDNLKLCLFAIHFHLLQARMFYLTGSSTSTCYDINLVINGRFQILNFHKCHL